MLFNLNYYSISLLFGTFAAIFSGLVVFLHNKKEKLTQVWLILTTTTAIWSFGYFVMTNTTQKWVATYADWILHYAAILIPLFYLLLVLIITDTYKKNRVGFITCSIFTLIFITITPTTFFLQPEISKVVFTFAPVPGPLYVLFFIYFCALITYGCFILFIKIKQAENRSERLRLGYIIIFTISAVLGGGSVFVTTFFPVIPPYTLILFSIYPLISTYAIFKHNLFNIKMLGVELLVVCLWFFVLIRFFFTSQKESYTPDILLFTTCIFVGIFIIRNIINEIGTREKIEGLVKDLERANTRLQELDKKKSEFVSFASHQLRGPLAVMKGYSTYLLGKDLSAVPVFVQEAVGKMNTSTDSMTGLVNEYLDITRIEQDSMVYNSQVFDLQKLTESIIEEWRPTLLEAGQKAECTYEGNIFTIQGDENKIKEVIYNLIDNALKYSESRGTISILLKNTEGLVGFSIQDTGIGMDQKTLSELFEKFTRAPEARANNYLGTGLGLYVAKKIIEAHGGKIWAESEGPGKGSTFFIELKTS